MRNAGRRVKMDEILLADIFLLVVVGLLIMYSASAYNGQVRFHDSYYYLKKQAFAMVLGTVCMLCVSNVDYHIWKRYALVAYILAITLSVIVIFFGKEYNGSKRWLSLGPLSFQPSEFSKVVVIIFLSYIVCNEVKSLNQIKGMFKIMILSFPVVGLVGASNLSTAIIILGIAVILIFVASPKYLPFIGMGGMGIGFLSIFLSLESYRLERLAIWRNPEKYEKGYQTLQGLYAIGSGGLFGKGFGFSIQKLGFVPEAQNDMIFSIVCEEFGLVGSSILIILFWVMIWRFYVISTHAEDLFGALLAAGAMGHMMIQVILNIAVVTNSIPNTGITLPFVSYGGTSVLFLLTELGIVLNVSKNMKFTKGMRRNKNE